MISASSAPRRRRDDASVCCTDRWHPDLRRLCRTLPSPYGTGVSQRPTGAGCTWCSDYLAATTEPLLTTQYDANLPK